MEAFNALRQADVVRTFPSLTMPPAISAKKKGRLSKTVVKADSNVQLPGLGKTDRSNAVGETIAPVKGTALLQTTDAPEKQDVVEATTAPSGGFDMTQFQQPQTIVTSKEQPEKTANASPLQQKAVSKTDVVLDQLRDYVVLMDKYSAHNFMIYDGHTLQETPEYKAFKRSYQTNWGSICAIIKQIEDFMTYYEIKLAIINGPKVYTLSKLNLPTLSRPQMYQCISNIEQIEMYIDSSVESGVKKLDYSISILRLQAAFRGCLARYHYKNLLKRIMWATKIQSIFRRAIQRSIFNFMKKKQDAHVKDCWQQNKEKLIQWWSTLPHERSSPPSDASDGPKLASLSSGKGVTDEAASRTVLFVPSVTIEEYLRKGYENFHTLQNSNINSLYQLADKNVTLIYVVPCAMADNDVEYHKKLLALMGVKLLPQKLYFVTPEMINVLPAHVPLSLALWCSTVALTKIRSIIARSHRPCIISSTVTEMEKRLSTFFDLPILSVDPVTAKGITNRSNMKTVFVNSQVNTPIGAHDIYNAEELVVALSRLIASNLGVNRWIIRLNTDGNNESIAYLDVEKVPLANHLRKEQHQVVYGVEEEGDNKGDDGNINSSSIGTSSSGGTALNSGDAKDPNVKGWYTKHVQLSVRKRLTTILTRELGSKMTVCRPDIYRSWDQFMRFVSNFGCVIEAQPLSTLGYVEGLCFIDPLGGLRDTTHGVELFVDRNYSTQGFNYPQRLTPPNALTGATLSVARTLFKQYGVIGYVTVKFLSFWDPQDQIPRLWGMDVRFGMNAFFGALGVSSIVTRPSRLLVTTRMSAVDEDSTPAYSLPPSLLPSIPEGVFCTYIPMAVHQPLRSGVDQTFFELCKMRGIAFDTDRRVGSLFFLVDGISGGSISLLCIGSTRKESIEIASKTLFFIQQQFGKDYEASHRKFDNLSTILTNINKCLKLESSYV